MAMKTELLGAPEFNFESRKMQDTIELLCKSFKEYPDKWRVEKDENRGVATVRIDNSNREALFVNGFTVDMYTTEDGLTIYELLPQSWMTEQERLEIATALKLMLDYKDHQRKVIELKYREIEREKVRNSIEELLKDFYG